MKLTLKDIVALVIALVSLSAIVVMWNAEAVGIPEGLPANDVVSFYQTRILPGLKQYSQALGLLFLAVSVAFILVGRQEEIATRPDKD